MADTFTPNFNLTMPEIGASVDTWGNKLNINMSEIDKFLVPPGGIVMWSGSVANIPNNWALCDGTNGTPDLRGLFVVGAGGAYDVGATGGANTVTLSTAQIPAHSHVGSTGGAGGHSHSASSGTAGDHTHTGSTASAGSHGHSGSTNTTGSHGHSGTANSAGNHAHTIYMGGASSGPRQRLSVDAKADSHSYIGTNNATQPAGTHTHSLSINANGNHSHSLSINANGSHTHTVSVGSAGAHTHTVSVASVSNHTHSVSVGNTGGGGSHENRPPYYALAFIMNIG